MVTPRPILLLFASIALVISCDFPSLSTSDDVIDDGEVVTVSFTESTSSIVNPERGFYGGAVDIFKASNPVKTSAAKALRAQGITLMYVGFYLTDFIKGDISQAYLDMVQSSLDAIREAGIKCVLRFAYQNSEGSKPWDPTEAVTLRHVEQLKPILQKNADVIFVLQAGFVGVWGEWYYTDNFIMNPSSNADYQPRRHLTDALLDAMPESRQIALRTPQFKMRMYGLSLKDTLTATTAHSGSALSRLCGHNDCFGASADDYGTFDNETADRRFWQFDTRYTLMGGETCKVSDYCKCPASLQDMKDYHWTYLNSGYNSSVLNRWSNSGCMEEITNRLGYRLVMEKVTYSSNPEAGKTILITLHFRNDGFAAPMNPRNAELVFADNSGKETRFKLGCDPRTWHSGSHEVKAKITLPSNHGTCFLDLSDPLLPNRSEYSIALANTGVFDSKTGRNKLFEF